MKYTVSGQRTLTAVLSACLNMVGYAVSDIVTFANTGVDVIFSTVLHGELGAQCGVKPCCGRQV